jgi:23S rRNA pseudouridine2457 synthase
LLIGFNKPYGVLSQFTSDGSPHRALSAFGFPPRVYPLGRLDADSEGLLLLSDEPGLNSRLLHPSARHERTYWALVERRPSPEALNTLASGIEMGGMLTRPCRARVLDPQPEVPPRDPPVRFRKNVADWWIELTLTEGKNRQVRKMTAAVGHPTLRLIRMAIGRFTLDYLNLSPGHWRELSKSERELVLN